MKGLDREFATAAIERLSKLARDAKPKWGTMTADEVVPHLIAAIRSSTGEIEPPAFIGNWFTKTILPPIVYTGLLLPPKNLKTKSSDGTEHPVQKCEGDLDTLAETIEDFIARLESGSLTKTTVHPLFGDIGAENWAKVHILHYKHHFKQFGI